MRLPCLVQELFIDLWTKRSQLNITSLESYLKVAIRHRVIYYIRTKKATLDLEVVEELIEKYTADSKLLQSDISQLLENNVAQLPEKCRQIFTLSRKEYLSNKEIASRLNISIKNRRKPDNYCLALFAHGADGLFAICYRLADGVFNEIGYSREIAFKEEAPTEPGFQVCLAINTRLRGSQ
jgi:RNA polymerase sigma factor (sigma-70 family)